MNENWEMISLNASKSKYFYIYTQTAKQMQLKINYKNEYTYISLYTVSNFR